MEGIVPSAIEFIVQLTLGS